MRYCVEVKQIYHENYYVEANNPAEALEKTKEAIEERYGEELVYDCTLESDTWGIYKIK